MSEMLSVCIIGIYFGKFPVYFPMWLRSAKENKSIDYLIFTDQAVNDLPENIKIINTTLDAIKNKAEVQLGFPISLERPYKLCDLRPAYGEIFSEYISKYDYWGHCDFDMIFGDIRSFLVKHNLEEYDKFLDHGHLSLYRNTKENNHRYVESGSKCGDYKTVFSSSNNCAFDEDSGISSIFLNNGFRIFNQYIYADISKIHKRFTLARNDNNSRHQIFIWNNGKTIRRYLDRRGYPVVDEFIYIHFKERGQLPYQQECLTSDSFLVTNQGFFPLNADEDTVELIQAYNPYSGWFTEITEEIMYVMGIQSTRIKRKFGLLKQR